MELSSRLRPIFQIFPPTQIWPMSMATESRILLPVAASALLSIIGNGDGTFSTYSAASLPNAEPVIGGFAFTYAVNAGDYNNDGNADLIGTDNGSARAAVSLSQVQQYSNASALTNVAVFPLGSGIHNVDASYSGDSIYIGSLSSTVPLTAAPVNTSITLTASPNTSILNGQSVTLTAVLVPLHRWSSLYNHKRRTHQIL